MSLQQQSVLQSLSQQQQTMHSNKRLSQESDSSQQVRKAMYCQPCYKRGYRNRPSYVNLNEFQSNRYICESCSVGQTYIVPLGKGFLEEVEGKSLRNEQINITSHLDITQKEKKQKQPQQSKNSTGIMSSINVHQSELNPTLIDEKQPQIQFLKNIKCNYHPENTQLQSQSTPYISQIISFYESASQVIDKYEEMSKNHIQEWRNKLRVQFEGVLGTFTGKVQGDFLNNLKQMQVLDRKVKELEKEIRLKEDEENCDILIEESNMKQRLQKVNLPQVKSSKQSPQSLLMVYEQTLTQQQSTQQTVQFYIQLLKTSGIRNFSSLQSLLSCCKGFSGAVQILVNLEHNETNRRFEFIRQKLKSCSIQALYDAIMINCGMIDNKIQKPPTFDIAVDKKKNGSSGSEEWRKKRKEMIKANSRNSTMYGLKISQNNISNNNLNNSIENSTQQQPQLNDHLKGHPEIRKQQQSVTLRQQQNTSHKFDKQQVEISISSQSDRQQSIPVEPFQKISHRNFQGASQQPKIAPRSFSQFKKSQNSKIVRQNQQQEMSQMKMQRNRQITAAVLQQEEQKFEKMRLAKLKSKKPFQSALLNQNKINREQAKQLLLKRFGPNYTVKDNANTKDHGNSVVNKQKVPLASNEIDLQSMEQTHTSANPNIPYPSMQEYYQYEKNTNIHQYRVELTQQNYEIFPPPQLYLPSVQSLVLKYCPPNADPLQILKAMKCFKKLGELIIEDSRFASKDAMIMITQYFSKIKSLVIICPNEFDFNIGKLIQKKLGNIVKFVLGDSLSTARTIIG